MQLEKIPVGEPVPNGEAYLRRTNQIEMSLIKASHEDYASWIEEDGEHFREILEANSNWQKEYNADKDAFMDKVEVELEEKKKAAKK